MKKAATAVLLLSLAIPVVVSKISSVALAQSAQDGESRETIRDRMIKLLGYVELEKKVTQTDVDRMVELWSRAARPGLSLDDRTAAFRDLFAQYRKLHGMDSSSRSQAAAAAVAQRAATLFQAGGRLDLRLPEPRGPISGDYIHVETRGCGPLSLLLIADAGVDGQELYRSFIERNKDRYRMHVVTLPGAGKARPQPWPETFDPTRRPWLNNIEGSLVRLVEKEARGKLIVMGTAIGGYFAARLALLKPEKVRAAVLVNAQVNVPLRSLTSPDRPATLQERVALLKTYAPSPQLFPFADVPRDRAEIKKLLDDPKSTHPAVKNWMAFAVKNEALSKQWTLEALASGFFMRGVRYGAEIQTTDLTEDFGRLSVPTLAMSALPDSKSPLAGAAVGAAQWAEIKRLYPSIPLTLATFADTRSYISEDSPEEFDRALSNFLSGLAPARR